MKKILISVLVLLLLILTYIVFAKGINAGFININSIKNIKNANAQLETDLNTANQLANVTYLNEVENLENAITKLKSAKKDYESKNLQNIDNEILETVQVKTYTIHYLWTVLGNYKKDRKLESINLDLKSTQAEDVYDLEFTLLGNYVGITDFLYDIEDDENLNFEIQNLLLSTEITTTQNSSNVAEKTSNNTGNNTKSNANTSVSEKSTQKTDGTIIQATFTVKNVGITLE